MEGVQEYELQNSSKAAQLRTEKPQSVASHDDMEMIRLGKKPVLKVIQSKLSVVPMLTRSSAILASCHFLAFHVRY